MTSNTGIYLHVPKTGGKSTKKIIDQYEHIKSVIVVEDKLFYAQDFVSDGYPRCNIDDVLSGFKWCFVRNPFDRLISVKHAWSTFYKISKSIEELIDLCKVGDALSWNIDPFNLEVMETFRYQKTDMAILYHLKPMHIMINNFCKIINSEFDFIGRYENIQNDWEIVKTKLHITDELPVINKSEHNHYTAYFENPNWVDDIIDIYKQDFIQFNYRREI